MVKNLQWALNTVWHINSTCKFISLLPGYLLGTFSSILQSPSPLPPNSQLKCLSYISQRNIDVRGGRSHFHSQLPCYKHPCVHTRVLWRILSPLCSPYTLVSQNKSPFPASSSFLLDLGVCRMAIEITCEGLFLPPLISVHPTYMSSVSSRQGTLATVSLLRMLPCS